MSNSPYFEQKTIKIQHLLSEGKLKEALLELSELKKQYPDSEDLDDLENEIREKVEEHNEKLLQEKIVLLENLLKEKKYSEVMTEGTKILQTNVKNSKLEKLINNARENYKEQINEQRKIYLQKIDSQFSELLENNHYQLILEISELEARNKGKTDVYKITEKFKKSLIDKIINEKKDVLNGTNFRIIENILGDLKEIDPENPKVKTLEKEIRNKENNSQLSEEKNFLYEGLQHINTLSQLKKYEKAIQAIDELLIKYPTNAQLKKLKSKLKTKYYYKTREECISIIEHNNSIMAESYKQNPENFLRI